jgi:hypothetical protein
MPVHSGWRISRVSASPRTPGIVLVIRGFQILCAWLGGLAAHGRVD